MSLNQAEGNVITTPNDLSVWVEKLLTGRAGLTPETVALMTEVVPTYEFHQYYGLGLVNTPGLGYGHNGGHAGYMTVMRYDYTDQVSLVMSAGLLNGNDVEGQGNVMYEIGRLAKKILQADQILPLFWWYE